jgi:hypothetical protein
MMAMMRNAATDKASPLREAQQQRERRSYKYT